MISRGDWFQKLIPLKNAKEWVKLNEKIEVLDMNYSQYYEYDC